MTLVVDARHLRKASTLLPDWWEILTVEERGFRVTRRGRKNPERDARTLVELIWREDALELLEARGAAKGFRRSPRQAIWDRLCDLYTVEEIAAMVRMRLKARATTEAD